MTTETRAAITAADVVDLLESRYPRPEWHTERELTLATKRLDFVAFCLWGGNGRRWRVLGFEVKVSRGDWLRELKAVEKAQHWARVVDEFYVVAPAGIVPLEELPRGWGLLQLHGAAGGSLRLKAHPTPATPSDTLPRELVARLLDRSARSADPSWRAELEAARRAAEDAGRANVAAELMELRTIVDQHRALLSAAGLSRSHDPIAVLRTAMQLCDAWSRLPTDWEYRRPVAALERIAAQSRTALDGVRDSIAVLQRLRDAAAPPPAPDSHA